MSRSQSVSVQIIEMMPWVELSDGVQFLSVLLGSPVSRDDVLRLALEGHLVLSVRFLSGVTVQPGKAVPFTPDMVQRVPTLDGKAELTLLAGTLLPGGHEVIRFDDRVATISDVWDLPMVGGERHVVENLYEQMHFRDAPDLIDLEGTFVTDSAGSYFKLVERFGSEFRKPHREPYDPTNFYPAAGLPEEAVLVLRPIRLREFAARFADTRVAAVQEPKHLGNRERTTLLTIIAALAKIANVPLDKPSKSAVIIESQTELMGARVAARTIENHLKAISGLDRSPAS